MIRSISLFIFLSFFFSTLSLSGPKLKMTKSGPKPVIKEVKKSPQSHNKVLWDNWYIGTIHDPSLKKPVPYLYFNEKVEEKGKDIHYQYHRWTKEEGFINEEMIGSFAENTSQLRPLYYHLRQTYRTSEMIIDGSVNENGMLTAVIKNQNKDLGKMKRHVPKKVFLSSMFPVWVGKNIEMLKKSSNAKSFMTIIEDNVGQRMKLASGLIRREKNDDFANNHQLTKFHVKFNGVSNYWWVNDLGAAVKIEIPSQNLILEKTSEKNAKKFFQSR